ncbi:MAG: hypothetical protein IJQ75_03910 [Synergistaceae bacterium]|nr:hypothetical protein [Synergistaceae bacterium]
MRNILHGNLSGGDIYVTLIDADMECSSTAEDFMLSKYDTGRKYRSRISSVQEFFVRNNLLRNHIFWVHNFPGQSAGFRLVKFLCKISVRLIIKRIIHSRHRI